MKRNNCTQFHATFFYRAQYTAYPLDVSITGLQLDTASPSNTGMGQAFYVEQCLCPKGYTGISCEVRFCLVKVHIFREGHKILRNLPLTFDYIQYSQK